MRTLFKIIGVIVGIILFVAGWIGYAYLRGKHQPVVCVRVKGALNVSRVVVFRGSTSVTSEAESLAACRYVKGELVPLAVEAGPKPGVSIVRAAPVKGDPITVLDPATKKTATLEWVAYDRESFQKLQTPPADADEGQVQVMDPATVQDVQVGAGK